MGRVSVPFWLVILSDQLPVIGLVGFYSANNLIGRGLIPKRLASLTNRPHPGLHHLSVGYPRLRGRFPRVTQPSATNSILPYGSIELVRLAYLRHAANINPEPGSNSPYDFDQTFFLKKALFLKILLN